MARACDGAIHCGALICFSQDFFRMARCWLADPLTLLTRWQDLCSRRFLPPIKYPLRLGKVQVIRKSLCCQYWWWFDTFLFYCQGTGAYTSLVPNTSKQETHPPRVCILIAFYHYLLSGDVSTVHLPDLLLLILVTPSSVVASVPFFLSQWIMPASYVTVWSDPMTPITWPYRLTLLHDPITWPYPMTITWPHHMTPSHDLITWPNTWFPLHTLLLFFPNYRWKVIWSRTAG